MVRGSEPWPRPGPALPGWVADRSGFTLIEVVALMAILGLLLAVALPALPRAVSRPQVEALALTVAAILDGDHRAAMRRHADIASIVDLKRRRVSSGAGGRSLVLPDGVAITSVLARTCRGAPIQDEIVFLPDGLSCGGSIALDRAGQTVDIRVNWLTGATEIVSRAP